ncbi:MAG: glycosyltransferase family 39 protein [Chloroflexi bacterium]|nr:glycosyltransferase family 39 protein [Chloroflexota bacterium]
MNGHALSVAAAPTREQAAVGADRPLWRLAPLLVALLTFTLYAGPASSVVQLSPDMVEYVDVARRAAAGEGYLLGIKAYHVGGTEVIQDGLIHRPPLFTLLVAAVLRLGLGLTAAQVMNGAIGALSAALVCVIGTRLFGRSAGLAAGLLAAASPIALEQQVPLLTDALATALTLGAVYLLAGAVDRPRPGPFALAGLVFGLGYLTRPPVLVVMAAVILALVLSSWGRRCLVRPLAALLGGAAAVCLPITLYSLLALGRLSYSGKGYLLAVVSDMDVMERGFAAPVPSPFAFISSHLDVVITSILNLAALYARWLFLEREWMLPLAVAWPFVGLALVRREYPRGVWVVLAAATANYLFYVVSWAIWQDRYMLTTLFLLLPFATDGVLRGAHLFAATLGARGLSTRLAERLPALILGIVVAVTAVLWSPTFVGQYQGHFRYGERPSGTRLTDGLRWTGPPRWVNDGSLDDVIEWARADTSPDAVLAHGQPWPYAFFTRHPAVLLPYALDDDHLRRFLVEYRVSYLLLDPSDRNRRGYRDQLEALEADGVRREKVGDLSVYDTRVLWR